MPHLFLPHFKKKQKQEKSKEKKKENIKRKEERKRKVNKEKKASKDKGSQWPMIQKFFLSLFQKQDFLQLPLLNLNKGDLSKFLQRPVWELRKKREKAKEKRGYYKVSREKVKESKRIFFAFGFGEMNRGHVLPVQQMVAGISPSWWSNNMSNTRPPIMSQQNPTSTFLPPPSSNLFPHYTQLPPLSSSWHDNQELPESWSQLLL